MQGVRQVPPSEVRASAPGGSDSTFKTAAIGRDPNTIVRSMQIMVKPDNLGDTREEAKSFIEAGATHIVLGLRSPYPEGIVHRIAEEIVEPLRG